MATYEVDVGGKTYEVDAPDEKTAWKWANIEHKKASSGKAEPVRQAAESDAAGSVQKSENAGILANIGMGALKGASDIGTTIMRPVDALLNATGISDYTNKQRKADQKYLADYYADPDSIAFKGGEIGAQIAGTAGVGGALAKGVTGASRLVPAAANYAPKLASALESGGFTLGGAPATTGAQMAANGATRVLGGAMAGGASAGLINPSDVGVGAALGGAMPIVGKVAGEVGRGAKAALYDPIFNQQQIIDATLKRAVGQGNAAQVAQSVANMARTPGVKFSAGEASMNPALAAMEDAFRAQNPGGALGAQASTNRTALAQPLRDIAKDDAARLAAVQARDAAAAPLYARASTEMPAKISPQVESKINDIISRPAIQQAMQEAKILAKNEGIDITNEGSIQGLHYSKLALDGQISAAKQAGDANKTRILMGLKDKLGSVMDDLSPTYRQASETFASRSQPINQMDMGKYLAEKLIPSTSGDNPVTLKAASLATALQNPDHAAQLATGFSGAKMSTVLTPEQFAAVQGVNADASRIAEALKLGMGNGSPTARRLATGEYIGQNLAEQAPVLSRIMQSVGNMPLVGAVPRVIGGMGSMAGKKINADMATKLEEMLAANPQAVADALLRVSAQGQPLLNQQAQALLRTTPIAIQASP